MNKNRKLYRDTDLKYLIYEKTCMDCGKKFDVRIFFNTRKVMDGAVYWGIMQIGIGDWPAYRLEGHKFIRIHPLWKHWYYQLKDFKRWLFGQYEEIEMWSCPRCSKNSRARVRRKEKKNGLNSIGSETVQASES